MISPFSGNECKEIEYEYEFTFRGEKFNVMCKRWECLDTGQCFSTSEQDDEIFLKIIELYLEKHPDEREDFKDLQKN